tara:strand:+ start:930 stop:1688 length:759 start_codon:yes stop_codon:yes gene_type:complete
MHIDNSSISVCDLNEDIYKILRNVVDLNFDDNEEYYNNLSQKEYRKLLLKAQENLQRETSTVKIARAIINDLKEYSGENKLHVQSSLYLRGSRPVSDSVNHSSESIGWHREYFYGQGMENAINIWIPIRGVTSKNALRFIPESQNIPKKEIKISQYSDPYTSQFSTGHKLGFQYSPKKIVSGVDLSRAMAFPCENRQFVMFSGNLVHGSAINFSEKIRFSIDFRVIPSRFAALTKQAHYASDNKPYFEEIDI